MLGKPKIRKYKDKEDLFSSYKVFAKNIIDTITVSGLKNANMDT